MTMPERVAPPSLGGRAAADLLFIRETMARSRTFSAVPGWGGVVMGATGLVGAFVASRQASPSAWLLAWLATAAVACVVGLVAMRRKAGLAGETLTGAAGRRFAASLLAPLGAGALLTAGLWRAGAWELMPAAWLLLYGAATVTGGAFSVPAIWRFGLVMMALGTAALLTPAAWGDLWLALGFGVVQMGFGLFIARYHGG
ncbi:MAG: hypothetical protein AB7O67_16800 [Vicinamibacterales bacterium]